MQVLLLIIRNEYYYKCRKSVKASTALNSEKICQCNTVRHYSEMHVETAAFLVAA